MIRKGTHPSPAVRQDHLEAVPQHNRCVGVQGHSQGWSVAPGTALGKVARNANQGLSTWKSSKAFTMRRPWASMTQASSLEKEKAKALGKGSLGKSKPNKPRLLALQDGEVDPPTEEPEPPSEEQILAQTRKQASKAEAMVHKLQGELDQTLEKVKSKVSRTCCLEKGQGPAAGQLEEGVLASAPPQSCSRKQQPWQRQQGRRRRS